MAHLCSYSNFRSEIFMFAQILFWVISSNGFNSTANFPRLLKIMNSFKYIKLLEEERLIRVFLGLISMALCYVLLKFIQTTLRWNYFTKKNKICFSTKWWLYDNNWKTWRASTIFAVSAFKHSHLYAHTRAQRTHIWNVNSMPTLDYGKRIEMGKCHSLI